MRLSVELLLQKNRIDKDKNRIILHIIKLLMEKESKETYRALYEDNKSSPKNINFSIYMGRGVKFLRDEIEIPSQKIIVNFSTYDPAIGIAIYNSFIKNLGLEIPIKNNLVTINEINLRTKRTITKDVERFKIQSPIVIREHKNDNKTTYYHDISDEKGQKIFLENLRYQIKDEFPDIKEKHLDEIDLNVIWSKLINVKHYGIVIPSNIGEIEIRARGYILEYLYLSGIGGRRSQGFGYVDLLD